MPKYRVFEVAEKRILVRRIHYIETDSVDEAKQLAGDNWEDDWEPMGELELTPSGFHVQETNDAPTDREYEPGEFGDEWYQAAMNFDSAMKQIQP